MNAFWSHLSAAPMPIGSGAGLPLHAELTGVSVAMFCLVCARAPWRSWLIGHPDRQHVWLGSLVVLLLMGSLRIGITPALYPQFLLVATLTLMHGWMLAMVGTGIVLAASCFQHGDWVNWPAYFLCEAALPALFIHGLNAIVTRRLSRNFWVFIFVTAFAGSIAAFVLAALALLAVAGSLTADRVAGDYLVVVGMMAFAQAYMNGLLMSAAVVYRPDWVASFDDGIHCAR